MELKIKDEKMFEEMVERFNSPELMPKGWRVRKEYIPCSLLDIAMEYIKQKGEVDEFVNFVLEYEKEKGYKTDTVEEVKRKFGIVEGDEK
jgi:hypothetical protein